jgi:hypothetical protein
MSIVVYFSEYSTKSISKDALSKVSRGFFKDFKMNYKTVADIFDFWSKLFKFFSSSSSCTI